MSLSEVQALPKRTSNILVPQSLIPRRACCLAMPPRSPASGAGCRMRYRKHGTARRTRQSPKRYRKAAHFDIFDDFPYCNCKQVVRERGGLAWPRALKLARPSSGCANSIPIPYPTGITGDLALLRPLHRSLASENTSISGSRLEEDRHAISLFGVIVDRHHLYLCFRG